MGLCGSVPEEAKRSAMLEEEVKNEFENTKNDVKLLLLGAGESGKSTIFKQMKLLYGEGFSDEDLEEKKPIIRANIIQSMKTLITAADNFGFEVEAQEEKATVQSTPDGAALTPELGSQIQTLWNDPGIQEAYGQRSKFQLNDTANYFFNQIERVAAVDYKPNREDILRVRVRTSGIVEERYNINDTNFIMYDVGGQRNERRKWMHAFDGVTAVIFVAALSEYDQVLYEDETTNRMYEAIELFDDICNSRWFKDTAMILFLNKKDLFREKIKRVDLRCDGDNGEEPRFIDYTHGCCVCDEDTCELPDDKGGGGCRRTWRAMEYISNQFKNVNSGNKMIIEHFTCATDTENVNRVFNDCKMVILDMNMRGSTWNFNDQAALYSFLVQVIAAALPCNELMAVRQQETAGLRIASSRLGPCITTSQEAMRLHGRSKYMVVTRNLKDAAHGPGRPKALHHFWYIP